MFHSFTKNRKRGQVIISLVLFFLLISSIIVFGLSRAVFHRLKSSFDFNSSRASYYVAEALSEDISYRFVRGIPVSGNPTLSLNNATAEAQINDVLEGKEIISSADYSDLIRKVRTIISYGTGGSFFYGVQVGEGGLYMYNTSSVGGNVHSSGPIVGTGNKIYGDALSAGPDGLIDNVHATSSAYAHTIQDSIIDKDAYYINLVNTTVGGTEYPNSPNQPTTTLPISDSQIDQWEIDAASGGSVTCTNGKYTIDENTTIGPKRIPCDLVISSNPIVTLTGAIWIEGDFIITNNPIIQVTSAFIDRTIPVIADNPADRLNSSRIDFQNASEFLGSGNNSYILFVSRNESASFGGTVDAINAGNSLTGEVLLYAPHGNVTMNNSVDLREVTAYKLTLRNTAKIIYKSGLSSIIFASGPSGGFEVHDWREVQ